MKRKHNRLIPKGKHSTMRCVYCGKALFVDDKTKGHVPPRFGENESSVYLYALLDIDMSEKDSSLLNPRNKPHNCLQPACRYDAQYSTLDNLSV